MLWQASGARTISRELPVEPCRGSVFTRQRSCRRRASSWPISSGPNDR